MQTPHSTRSSVLGKRSYQSDSSSSPLISCSSLETLINVPPTPEQTPNRKRVKFTSAFDPNSNKENVPPSLSQRIDDSPMSARSIRALRRTTTTGFSINPVHPAAAPLRRASTSNIIPVTPALVIAQSSISTPPPTPTLLFPIYARVRALLRPTSNGITQMPGREKERSVIMEFVDSFLNPTNGVATRSLYISGSPGTGKTALVNSILHSLDLDPLTIKLITINCMTLNCVDSLWDQLTADFLGINGRKKKNKVQGRSGIESELSRVTMKCILVLDELDHIATSLHSLNTLFSLPNSCSNLCMIGIANTHTLTSSPGFSAQSIIGVQILHFAPYTPAELLKILQSRLAPLCDTDTVARRHLEEFLPLPTWTLLTKRIAAHTGDVRSLFEVLRGAIDLAVSSMSSDDSENPLNIRTPAVTPTHILTSLKAYVPVSVFNRRFPSNLTTPVPVCRGDNSETITKVSHLGLQTRLVLLSVLLAAKRLEANLTLLPSIPVTRSPVKRPQSVLNVGALSGIEITQLHAYYIFILARTGNDVFTPVSRSEFGDLIGMLEGVGLVVLSSSTGFGGGLTSPSKGARGAFGRSASFGGIGSKGKLDEVRVGDSVRVDEVLRGLGITADGTAKNNRDVRKEEVVAIWEKEKARLTRDIKAKEKATGSSSVNAFEGAMKD